MRGLDISTGGDSLLTVVPDLQSLAIVDLRTASRSVSYVRLDSLAVDPEMRVYDLRVVKGGRVFILFWSMAHGRRLHLRRVVDLSSARDEATCADHAAGPDAGRAGAVLPR